MVELRQPSNASSEDIICEINDRSQRAHNLMLYKLPESTNSQISIKKAHDREFITNLFE